MPRPAGDAPVYGVNTGFGNFAETRIDKARPRRAAAEPAAQPRRRRRRAAAGARGARGDGAARQRAGQGLFRHSRRDARGAARAAQSRRASARAEPRIGRRQRRPRAARAPRAGAGRRRRDAGTAARRVSGARRAGRGRAVAGRARTRRKGSRSSTARRCRPRCWRWRWPAPSGWRRAADIAAALSIDALHGLDASVRAAHPRRAAVRRTGGVGRQPAAPDGRQRASTRRTSTAAASRTPIRCAARRRCTARRAKRSAWIRHIVDDRDERRHRQPDGVRRRRATSCRAATFTARRWRWPPICW